MGLILLNLSTSESGEWNAAVALLTQLFRDRYKLTDEQVCHEFWLVHK